MREIKFRGRARCNGKFVYGNLDYRRSKYRTEYTIRGQDANSWNYPSWEMLVDPESISQFVGVDKHGEEVYEGDIVRFEGEEFAATMANVDDIDVCELVSQGENNL